MFSPIVHWSLHLRFHPLFLPAARLSLSPPKLPFQTSHLRSVPLVPRRFPLLQVSRMLLLMGNFHFPGLLEGTLPLPYLNHYSVDFCPRILLPNRKPASVHLLSFLLLSEIHLVQLPEHLWKEFLRRRCLPVLLQSDKLRLFSTWVYAFSPSGCIPVYTAFLFS